MVSFVPLSFISPEHWRFSPTKGDFLSPGNDLMAHSTRLGICTVVWQIAIQITWLNSSLIHNSDWWNTIQPADCQYHQLLHFLLVSCVEPHQRVSRSFSLTFPAPLLESRALFWFRLPLFNMSSEIGKGKPDLRNALKNPDIPLKLITPHAVNHLHRRQQPKHLR